MFQAAFMNLQKWTTVFSFAFLSNIMTCSAFLLYIDQTLLVYASRLHYGSGVHSCKFVDKIQHSRQYWGEYTVSFVLQYQLFC